MKDLSFLNDAEPIFQLAINYLSKGNDQMDFSKIFQSTSGAIQCISDLSNLDEIPKIITEMENSKS